MTERSEQDQLRAENAELRARLYEAEETLNAIRRGEVDALLVSGPAGEKVYTLESAEQPYRILIEQMQEGAVTLAADGTILFCNLRFSQMLGYSHEKIIASSATAYVIEKQASQFASLLHTAQRQSARAEITLRTASGEFLPTFVTLSPLPVEVEGAVCMIVTDLTEQESMRRSQIEIQQLNARLQRSMTETHHRVKNNLQIIAAMVDMQVMEDTTTLPIEEMKRLGAHIKSLALIHDILTTESKGDGQALTISSRSVLEKLLSLLEQMTGGRRFRTHLEDVRISSRQATGLALVANEVVSNAAKHGNGEIEVTFQTQGESAILEVCDDGPGFPAGFDPKSLATTGISLVENLSRWDLCGSAQYLNRPEGGARVVIQMPLALPSA